MPFQYSKKGDENCILRKSYFHRIQPTHVDNVIYFDIKYQNYPCWMVSCKTLFAMVRYFTLRFWCLLDCSHVLRITQTTDRCPKYCYIYLPKNVVDHCKECRLSYFEPWPMTMHVVFGSAVWLLSSKQDWRLENRMQQTFSSENS